MRTRMVTRTVVGTQAEVQIVAISVAEISTINVTVGGTFDDDEKLLKVIKKQTETDDIKVLKIVTSEKIEKCYGMTEAEFIKLAKELDPSTRKALAIDEDNQTDEDEQPVDETTDEEQPVETTKTSKKGGRK